MPFTIKQKTSEPSSPHYTTILCGVGWFSVLITLISLSQKNNISVTPL